MGLGKSEIRMIINKLELLAMLDGILSESGEIFVRYKPKGAGRIGINIMGGISDVSYSKEGIQCTLLGDDIWGFEITIPKNIEESIDCFIKHNIRMEDNEDSNEDKELIDLIDKSLNSKNFKKKIDEFYMSIDDIDIHMLVDKSILFGVIGSLEDYVEKMKKKINKN